MELDAPPNQENFEHFSFDALRKPLNPELFDPIVVKIAEGSFGEVFKAVYCRTAVTVKRQKIDPTSSASDQLILRRLWEDEIQITRGLNHSNVVLYFNECELHGTQVIVMEPMESTLVQHLARNSIDTFHRLLLLQDICSGMNWIHNQGITHRDLKPANILISPSGCAKVADFGLATKDPEFRGGGQLRYMPPEFFQDHIMCTSAMDCYSFGILMWEVLTGDSAFNEYLNTQEEYEEYMINPKLQPFVKSNKQGDVKHKEMFVNDILNGERPSLDYETLNEGVVALIQQCWQSDQVYRPSFAQIGEALDKLITADASQFPALFEFWQSLVGKRLVHRFQITWTDFATSFMELFEPSMPQEALDQLLRLQAPVDPKSPLHPYIVLSHCIRSLLPDQISFHVDLQNLVTIFGPFEQENDKFCDVITRFYNICSFDWFIGTQKDAALDPAIASIGSTWIRFSTDRSPEYPFTLLARVSEGIVKRRIRHHPSTLRFSFGDGNDYKTLWELVTNTYPDATPPSTRNPFSQFFKATFPFLYSHRWK